MALTREQKQAAIDELKQLFASSKMTVAAKYSGLNVKDMQELRHAARENNTTVRVAKNRLVKKVLEQSDKLKNVDSSMLSGQLVYVFNNEDEVTAAQVLATFAKTHPHLEFVGGITISGEVMDTEQVKQLASLPTKEQLQAQLVGTIAAPLSGFVNVLSGNVRGLVNVLNARSQTMEAK